LGFGVAAAHAGHWPMLFWFHVGEAAFAISFLLNATVRLPLVRRARRGAIDPGRVAGFVLALAIAELTVLYLAVADMVIKPSSRDTKALATGGPILVRGLAAAAATALRATAAGDEAPASSVAIEHESRRAA